MRVVVWCVVKAARRRGENGGALDEIARWIVKVEVALRCLKRRGGGDEGDGGVGGDESRAGGC